MSKYQTYFLLDAIVCSQKVNNNNNVQSER